MKFGAPSHRIEAQLLSVASSIHLKMQAIHMPGVTILSFGNHDNKLSGCETRFVKSTTKIDLGRLHAVHKLYRRVVHYEQSTKEASGELKTLLKKDPIYGYVFIAIDFHDIDELRKSTRTDSSRNDMWTYSLTHGIQRLCPGPSRCRYMLWRNLLDARLGREEEPYVCESS